MLAMPHRMEAQRMSIRPAAGARRGLNQGPFIHVDISDTFRDRGEGEVCVRMIRRRYLDMFM
jgi:hypothetical protein